MYFDKSVVIEAVKEKLPTKERNNVRAIEMALLLCLDDMSMKLKSDALMASKTESVAALAQSFVFYGDNVNLDSIFSITITVGDTSQVLQFVDQKAYLRDYETQSITNGVPAVYTILASEFGSPTIKFERKLSDAGTITVYYFKDLTTDNIASMRSVTPFVMGTLGYFYGPATDQGNAYLGTFYRLVHGLKADDKFIRSNSTSVELSYHDKQVRLVQQSLRNRRS